MCTFVVETVVCGNNGFGNFSDQINVTLKDTSMFECSCSVAITSTSMLAGISFVYSIVMTVLVIIIIFRVKKKTAYTQREEQESPGPDIHYEDVGLQPAALSDMDTRKNIAYGQVMPPNT